MTEFQETLTDILDRLRHSSDYTEIESVNADIELVMSGITTLIRERDEWKRACEIACYWYVEIPKSGAFPEDFLDKARAELAKENSQC